MTTLDLTNARTFNNSLKKAIQSTTSQPVKVSIINSYKFPKCYVNVRIGGVFANEFRLKVFNAMGYDINTLRDKEDIVYGNINRSMISVKVDVWVNVFKQTLSASDLGFGHAGNGIIVWDRTREKNHDYLTVAHISNERVVEYWDIVSDEQKEAIEHYARTAHPNISQTQDQKVFITEPNNQ